MALSDSGSRGKASLSTVTEEFLVQLLTFRVVWEQQFFYENNLIGEDREK